VKLSQLTPEGHQVVLRIIGPSDAFGGVAAFGGGTYPVTAEAVTHVAVLEWPGPIMATLMEKYPRLALNAVRFVAARLHELQVQYRQLATEKVERRVARALLRLVEHAGRRTDSGVLIDLPLSRQDIAQMTGTTLYTVSRIISRFEGVGLVEAGRQSIVIRNPHGLMSVADDLTCAVSGFSAMFAYAQRRIERGARSLVCDRRRYLAHAGFRCAGRLSRCRPGVPRARSGMCGLHVRAV
jgi:CRP-like cAMP-binding protein